MCAKANETSIVHWYTSSHPFLFSLFPFFPSTCPSLILLSSFSHPSLILLSSFSHPSLILLSSFSHLPPFLPPSLPPSIPPSLHPSLLLPCPLPDRTWTHGCIMWSGWCETAGRRVIGSSTSSAANRAVATSSEHHQITVLKLFYEITCFLCTQIPSHTPSHLPLLPLSPSLLPFPHNRPFLLECTSREVRMSFCHITSSAVQSYISFGGATVSLSCLSISLTPHTHPPTHLASYPSFSPGRSLGTRLYTLIHKMNFCSAELP